MSCNCERIGLWCGAPIIWQDGKIGPPPPGCSRRRGWKSAISTINGPQEALRAREPCKNPAFGNSDCGRCFMDQNSCHLPAASYLRQCIYSPTVQLRSTTFATKGYYYPTALTTDLLVSPIINAILISRCRSCRRRTGPRLSATALEGFRSKLRRYASTAKHQWIAPFYLIPRQILSRNLEILARSNFRPILTLRVLEYVAILSVVEFREGFVH